VKYVKNEILEIKILEAADRFIWICFSVDVAISTANYESRGIKSYLASVHA
jgi:hypothetical protein